MTTSFTNHAFVTLTYSRTIPMDTAWNSVSKDFNRYIQKFRRFHNSQIQYIRSLEAHADSYPHIHIVLQFPSSLRLTNQRYFDRELFQKWKQLWTRGVTDYRPPNPKQESPVLYIVKYISKSTSSYRTLWKKLLRNVPHVEKTTCTSSNPQQNAEPVNSSTELTSDSVKFASTLIFCKSYKLRQLTWSRGFQFPALSSKRGLGIPPQCLITAPSN